jgi:aspartate/glutamate racemase
MILAPQGRYVQSAETAQIQATGEQSVLSQLSRSVSEYMTAIIREKMRWDGFAEETIEETSYTLNTDFFTNRLSSQDLVALVQTYQSGLITKNTFINNLKDGEIIDSSVNNEEYIESLEQEQTQRADQIEDQTIQETGALFGE